MHLNATHISDQSKEAIYHELIGWITDHSLHKWRNSEAIQFKKSDLNNKYQRSLKEESVLQAIFRNKQELKVDSSELDSKRDEVFVKQIESFNVSENVKQRRIKSAIEDFIRFEIEHTYIINNQGDITKSDFDNFLDVCHQEWEGYFDKKVFKEPSEYSEDEKKEIANDIYYFIMKTLKMEFKDEYSFSTNNTYIKNGSFLKLSNIPEIGWHPDWEEKFK